jgi:3-phosphoshikimate 1-carboxyvinyltransferase
MTFHDQNGINFNRSILPMTRNKDHIEIKKLSEIKPCKIQVPASKSESNRALIIRAISGKGEVKNLSTARDTKTMEKLLRSEDHTLDVIDAGTTMRFLSAYLSVKGNDHIITGTPRMCDRPIGILVKALRQLGADIEYLEKDGYPPLRIKGFQSSGQSEIKMKGDVSSQYISAILMIGPMMENGLNLELTGKISSRPYIDMTLGIMKHFGVSAISQGNIIHVPRGNYNKTVFKVDPDWSGASYWYAATALANSAHLSLNGFSLPSYQGDSRIKDIMVKLGVNSEFNRDGLLLTKTKHSDHVEFDFSDIPDLAQTVAVVCAAKGISAHMTGLESLRIKETDRIAALQNELSKIGGSLIEKNKNKWDLVPGQLNQLPEKISVNTYDDHRMAMAFAPLATKMNVQIENASVVNKSYPSFWADMDKAGFSIDRI